MAESLSQKPIPLYGIAFSPKWWAKAAMQVALDPAVSDKAYRVFTVIAAHGKGNMANVGQRRLAMLMRKTQSYISKRVHELRESGWLGTEQVSSGKRTVYVLLSEAYGGSAAEGSAPATAEAVTGVKCAHCHRSCKVIPVSGICRKCVREMDDERRLMAARQELGPDATVEQLALHCEIQRITPRIRRILRRIERAA
jgi:hypothetical protein